MILDGRVFVTLMENECEVLVGILDVRKRLWGVLCARILVLRPSCIATHF